MTSKMTMVLLAIATAILTATASDPTATTYTSQQCEGSLTPYPTGITPAACPDSLVAVMINHVGRHGSRYPASASNCMKLRKAIMAADSLGTLTELGRELGRINDEVIGISNGRWGALDSLGMAEQRAIATRMHASFPELFAGGTVKAISSYSPRAMMSMMSFVHQLCRLDNRPDYTTSSGRVNSTLLRPFDIDRDYLDFREEEPWRDAYEEYLASTCPTAPIARILGKDYPFENADQWRDLALTEYYVIAGLSAMGIECDASRFFTNDEYNALWSCFNLRQYLQRTASTVSSVPADIASALLVDLVNTTDNFIDGSNPCAVNLRFGHAETIMPLASLLRLPGCYYLTNYFDTVALHWRDFEIVPMASNIQMILLKAPKSGRYYLRVDLNESPVPLIPGKDDIYLPWDIAREYMMSRVPLYAQ